ncbi:hypothetical protein E2C01_013760 [Portunus trituberculatus]|uniref:Uncharacterized protein n=1 Tax=Portunus trituberculatus TaxID=210409 RepID=A0A5B7DH38_PORTR|nr:hypothetical protein [Portunus trituberculatus]
MTDENVKTKHMMDAKQTDKCIGEQVVNTLAQKTCTTRRKNEWTAQKEKKRAMDKKRGKTNPSLYTKEERKNVREGRKKQ